MPSDFCISDDPMSLADLARRWGLTKRILEYAVDSNGIPPTWTASQMALYGAVEQERIAKALERRRRYVARRTKCSTKPE